MSRKQKTLWMIDAYLWIALGVNLACIAAEKAFGVFSGFTLLLGATPAMLMAFALIFGGAAGIYRYAPEATAWVMRPREVQPEPARRRVKGRMAAFASDTPTFDRLALD